MADPLSVAAGVIGVVTAAVQVSKLLFDFTRRTKDAPKQATMVLAEVGDIHTIMAQLHPFVLGLEVPDQSRTCLIQVDSVIAILTGCVATFSELEELIDQLKAKDLGFLDRTKWAAKESVIAALITRLQTHKLSLSLMLTILNGTTMREVQSSVNRLEMTMRDDYQDILGRLRALELRQISPSRRQSRSSVSTSVSQPTIQRNDDAGDAQKKRLSRSVFRLAFEKDLAVTRVYKRIFFTVSTSSLLTTEEPETRWSVISGLSVADIASRISVLNLAITSSEVYNAEQYTDANVDKSTPAMPINSQIEGKRSNAPSNNQEEHIKDVSRSIISPYFYGSDNVVWSFSSERIVSSALARLGIPQRLASQYRLYALYYFDELADHSWRVWRTYAPEEMPLLSFTQWSEQGQYPVFMIRRYEYPFNRASGRITTPIEKLGYIVDGWPFGLIDAELFRLYVNPPH